VEKEKRNEQHARECFYFTAIIRTNKYKYHIVCDWKSILLLNIYKRWRKGSVGGKNPARDTCDVKKRAERINFQKCYSLKKRTAHDMKAVERI
jgi:hypothetical protein